MSILEKQFSAFFNSAGSTKLGYLGNQFQVQLNTPLSIPATCIYATLEVVSAKVWNTSPNISEAIGNNHLFFTFKGMGYDLVFPDGLWGTKEFNLYLEYFFLRNSLYVVESPTETQNILFVVEENDATQRVSIQFNVLGISIDFTKPNSCIDVMGFYTTHNKINDTFTSDLIITTTIKGDSVVAPNEARYNRVSNYFIRSNLVSDGIPVNNVSTGIISEIPVDVRVGSLINFVPTNPMKSDCTDLIGNPKSVLSFTLVDQLGRDVSTSNEDWSLAIIFRYYGFENQK